MRVEGKAKGMLVQPILIPPGKRLDTTSLDANGLYQRAFAYYRSGQGHLAEPLLAELLELHPHDPKAHLLKGVVHPKTEMAISMALVERAVRLDPADAQAWYNLGVFENKRGELAGGLHAYEQAVLHDPLHLDALNNGSELLRRFERFEESLVWCDRQLSLQPAHWAPHLNRAVSLFHLRRFAEAEHAYRDALALEPTRPIITWEMFPLLLAQKRFAEAWECFEQRFACGALSGVFHYPFPQPLWQGESLMGRHILVHNEQGLGDQIMYASVLPELLDEAARVTVVVVPELVSLFITSFPKARILPARLGAFAGDNPPPPWLDDLGDIDFQIPMGGMMTRRRASAQAFPRPAPYLFPGDTRRTRWANWAARAMPREGGARVGVCWAANPALFRFDSHRRGLRKSMTLEDMAPLAGTNGIQWVSVLNWPIEALPPAFAGKLRDVSGELTSLEETAALIAQLDLVVTVDTAVAHLAGAMGKPVWLLLHDFPDCRWGFEDDTSYWYPDVRLYRQSRAHDWAGVVDEVGKALELWALDIRARPPARARARKLKKEMVDA